MKLKVYEIYEEFHFVTIEKPMPRKKCIFRNHMTINYEIINYLNKNLYKNIHQSFYFNTLQHAPRSISGICPKTL